MLDPKGSGTNKHRYVVATQEREVRAAMREVAGVPLVYINRSVMVMEPMAERSAEVREADEKGKVRAGLKARRGAEVVSGEKRKAGADGEGEEGEQQAAASAPKRKKPKGPSGPNPLSVKKPKKEKTAEEKKSVGRKVEDERSVLRKAEKQDPQVGEKAVSAEVVVEGEGEGGAPTDGSKRKRKRKPNHKDASAHPGNDDAVVAAAVSRAIAEASHGD